MYCIQDAESHRHLNKALDKQNNNSEDHVHGSPPMLSAPDLYLMFIFLKSPMWLNSVALSQRIKTSFWLGMSAEHLYF